MAHHLRTELVLATLNMAIGQRRPKEVVHHSDKGSQYTSLAFGKRCREMGVLTSTGSAGDCFDNAMAESFFATLECELIQRRAFQTQAEARTAVFQFIEGWYNTRRRHSALDYLSPNDFERAATAAVVRPEGDGGPDGETDPEVFLIHQSEVHDYAPGLPDPSMLEKALLKGIIYQITQDCVKQMQKRLRRWMIMFILYLRISLSDFVGLQLDLKGLRMSEHEFQTKSHEMASGIVGRKGSPLDICGYDLNVLWYRRFGDGLCEGLGVGYV